MSDPTVELLRELRDSVLLLLKLRVNEIRGDRSTTDMIVLLDSLGCAPNQIASLLGTTAGTVRPILSRKRRK